MERIFNKSIFCTLGMFVAIVGITSCRQGEKTSSPTQNRDQVLSNPASVYLAVAPSGPESNPCGSPKPTTGSESTPDPALAGCGCAGSSTSFMACVACSNSACNAANPHEHGSRIPFDTCCDAGDANCLQRFPPN